MLLVCADYIGTGTSPPVLWIALSRSGSDIPFWCRSRSRPGSGPDPHAYPTTSFKHVASLQCFIFLISVKGVIIFSYFWTAYWNFLEKSIVYQLYHLLGNDIDPDRPALDADPDLTKWCGSDRIRIHNTVPSPQPLHSACSWSNVWHLFFPSWKRSYSI